MRHHGGIVVKSSGHECQKDSDPLILGCGDLEQFVEDSDLLSPVGVLMSNVNNGRSSRNFTVTFFPRAS